VSSSTLGRVDTHPPFLERVRKGLKAKRLKGKMLYTENERVRKRMKTKEGFFGEGAGINIESASATQGRRGGLVAGKHAG